jgi:hypothetical protein
VLSPTSYLSGQTGCTPAADKRFELILESQVHRCSQFYSDWRANNINDLSERSVPRKSGWAHHGHNAQGVVAISAVGSSTRRCEPSHVNKIATRWCGAWPSYSAKRSANGPRLTKTRSPRCSPGDGGSLTRPLRRRMTPRGCAANKSRSRRVRGNAPQCFHVGSQAGRTNTASLPPRRQADRLVRRRFCRSTHLRPRCQHQGPVEAGKGLGDSAGD